MVSVANKVMRDRGTHTGSNLARLQEETGINTWVATPALVKKALEESVPEVPAVDKWRIDYLDKLLQTRRRMECDVEDTRNIEELISSLCSS